MAFVASDLYQVGPAAKAPRFWTYTTTDSLATVNTSGYFNAEADRFTVNDVIMGVTSTGTTPVHAFYIVNSISAGVVDVTNGDVIDATDSD